MTIDEYKAAISNITKEIEKNETTINTKQLEYYNEYQAMKNSDKISFETSSNEKTSAKIDPELKDTTEKAVIPQGKYQNGSIFEYNGITYTYSEDYGAFVKKDEPLCTTENLSKYMIPKSVLKELNANVIVEFQPNVKNENSDIKEKNYFSTPYDDNPHFKTSNDGELPISRIYNVDHDIDKIYFEFNQTWAGNRKAIKNTPLTETTNGCFAFSLINGCPYDTQEQYDSHETCQSLKNTLTNVLSIFYDKNNDLKITSSNRYSEIAEASHIATALDASITAKEELKNIDKTKSYIIHTDNSQYGNLGEIKSSGTHFVMMIPSGIDGKCYIIDSNNSTIKASHKFTPFMSYDDAIRSIVSGKNRITDIAIPIDYLS